MRITRLALRDLRRHREADLDFAPGLTIVRGPNEAGKSTIQRAIELVLTRRVTSAAADLESLAPWDADPDARTVIGMTFTYEDEDGGTHEGSVEKSFRGPRGQVRLELGGEVITDPARADEELAAISGRPDRGLLPLHGVGPPPRARRAPAGRGCAARPPPGLDQRRGPRHQPGAQEARPGARTGCRRRAPRTPDG